MNVGFVLLTLSVAIVYGTNDEHHMVRRSKGQYHKMILKLTGRKHTFYQNHGNYCPKGGYGEPVDGIDRCCKEHGLCLKKLKGRCGRGIQRKRYFTRYYFKTKKYTCRNLRGSCRYKLCTCDRVAAECLAKETKKKQRI